MDVTIDSYNTSIKIAADIWGKWYVDIEELSFDAAKYQRMAQYSTLVDIDCNMLLTAAIEKEGLRESYMVDGEVGYGRNS